MAHFIRTIADPGWIGYTFAADGSDFSGANGLDVKLTKAINGDDGGTWAPSATIIIGGQGIRVMGLCLVSNGGLIETQSGTRFTLGDNDYPVLKSGHTGATQVRVQPSVLATSVYTMRTIGAGVQTSTVGQTFTIPLVKTHNGALMTQVVFKFLVGLAHAGVPAVLPMVRVFRQDANGVVVPLHSASGGVDAFGWLSLPTPGSGAAWFNGGAVQTFTYACDQNHTIDTSQYSYGVMITDESGANSHTDNIWLGMPTTFASIQDMRFQ